MLTVLGTAAGVILGLIVAGIIVYFYVSRRLFPLIRSFLEQPDEKTPSPLATIFDQAAAILSARLVLQAKTTLMGLASVESKNEAKAQAEAAMAENPTLVALANLIPGSKRLFRNPALLSLAGRALAGVGARPAGTPANVDKSNGRNPFHF